MKLSLPIIPPGHRRSVQLRRALAGVLVVAAGVSLVVSSQRSDPAVLTFARAIAVGEVVAEEDVQLVAVPEELLPEGTITDIERVVGRVTVTGVEAREIITELKVTGARLLDSLTDAFAEGSVPTIVPVRLADPASAALLRHGDTVTIVTAPGQGTSEDESTLIATGGRVVVVDSDSPETVLIALDEESAQRVASASLSSPLGVVLTANE